MMYRNLRYRSLSLMLLFIAMIFFFGCETLKGTVNGLKKDWDNLVKVDKKVQEDLW